MAQDGPGLAEGNGLYDTCSKTGGASEGICLGFIAGTVHGLEAEAAYNFFCLPRVRYGQIRDVVVKFLADNPKDRHRDSAALITAALAIAYPCPSLSRSSPSAKP
jgi:hypothetical protein